MVELLKSTCGPYVILQTIGEGTFGIVKKAFNTKTEKLVALKVMQSDALDSKLEREVSTLQMLKHENITNIIEVLFKATYKKKNGKVLNRDIIVMELAEKGDLFGFLKISFHLNPSGFPEPILRRLFHQMVEVIEYCHQNGIAHRDLKPENVLLDAEYNIKLADFGWATFIDEKYHKTAAGTKFYEAPEMKSKEGYLLEPVDIFALGAVLFTLKAGRRPFGSARSTDLFYRYINSGKPAEFWAQHEKMSDKITYSDDFKQLIQGMIEADPKTRFTIDDIKFSKWYTGEVADKSTVIAEFNKYEKERRLFSAIEDQKRKIQRQIAKLEDEDFIIIKNVFTEYRGEGEKCQKEIEAIIDGQLSETGLLQEATSYIRKIQKSDRRQHSSTSFAVCADLEFLYKSVIFVTNSLAEDPELSKSSYKVKGTLRLRDNAVYPEEFVVRIFSTEKEGEYTLEFTKKNFDYWDFVEFVFEKFIPELLKLLPSKATEEAK